MARLLPTRLPLAEEEVSTETFNRLVRVLEINLGRTYPSGVSGTGAVGSVTVTIG